MATLTAKNLAKAYKGRRVVEDVSLTVNSGEIVGLLGPNGAGKTTTFYMVVGIVPRDAGVDRLLMMTISVCCLCMHARAAVSDICRRKPPFSVASAFTIT